jgi:hypothetical protein
LRHIAKKKKKKNESFENGTPLLIHTSLPTDTILWTAVTPSGDKRPTARRGHTLTVVDRNRAVLIGGEDTIDEGSPYSFELDIARGFAWSQIDAAGAPPPCAYHSTVPWRRTLVVAGGFNGSSRARDEIDALDLDTLEWSPCPAKLVVPVSCHAAAVSGGRMYCFGGRRADSTSTAVVQSVSLDKWDVRLETPGGEGPPALHGHTATAVGSDVYVIGGWTSDGGQRLASVFRYDVRASAWDEVFPSGDEFVARSGHAAVAFGDRYILVHGGSDDYRPLDDTLVLDTYDMRWLDVAPAFPGGPGMEALALAAAEFEDHVSVIAMGGFTEASVLHPNGYVSMVALGDVDALPRGGIFSTHRRSIAERTAGIRGAGNGARGRRNNNIGTGITGWFSSFWRYDSGDDEYMYGYGSDNYGGDSYGNSSDINSTSSMLEFRRGKKSASEVLGLKHSYERRRNSDAGVDNARRASRNHSSSAGARGSRDKDRGQGRSVRSSSGSRQRKVHKSRRVRSRRATTESNSQYRQR